eukprot:g4233.t1
MSFASESGDNSSDSNNNQSNEPKAQLPILAAGKFYGNEFATVNPSLFAQNDNKKGPEYLSYRPRPAMERMVYNTGISYLAGTFLGASYGFFHGLRNSPSPRLRIRINTVLNGMTSYGSRTGNAIGVLAIMYSCFEAGADYVEVDRLVGNDAASPFVAALGTGMLYKATTGPKTMILAGALGATAMTSYVLGSKYLPINYAKEIFF